MLRYKYFTDLAKVYIFYLHYVWKPRDIVCLGQWSPLNPSGSKKYDREFLVQLKHNVECMVKPKGLPNLPEVVLDYVSTTQLLHAQ